MKEQSNISLNQIRRYPVYLKILRDLKKTGETHISSPVLAKMMNSSEEQVRKDLQVVSKDSGKPKVGRNIDGLINDIETFLGFNNDTDAILVGCGQFGTALLRYDGFKSYGLNIVAGFDNNQSIIGNTIKGKPVYSVDELEKQISELGVKIAILVTPASVAQEIADRLVDAGVIGILNFAPTVISSKNENVVIEEIDIASGLALLSHKLNLRNR